MTSIIAIIGSLIRYLPALIKVVGVVMDISNTVTNTDNKTKKNIAVTRIKGEVLPIIEKYGGNSDDVGTLIDFACVIAKKLNPNKVM